MKGAASISVLMCPRRPDGTGFCVRFRNLGKTNHLSIPTFLTACQNTAHKASQANIQGSRKHSKHKGSEIRAGRTTHPQLKQNSSSRLWTGFHHNWLSVLASVGLSMSHLTQLPFSSWGLLLPTHTSHWEAAISLRSPSTTWQHWSLSSISPPAPGAWSIWLLQAWTTNSQMKVSKTWRVYALYRHGGNMSDWTTNGRLLDARLHSGHGWRSIIWTLFRGATFLQHQKATARHNLSHVHFDTLEQEHYTPKGAVMFLHPHTSDQHRSPAMSDAYGCSPEGTRPPSVAPGN